MKSLIAILACLAIVYGSLALCFPTAPTYPQSKRVLAVTDGSTLGGYLRDPNSRFQFGDIYCFREGGNDFELFLDSVWGFSSRLSPKENFVSFWGTRDRSSLLLGEGYNPDLDLFLYSSSGEFIRSFDINVASYQWFPDENHVLFTTNLGYREGKTQGGITGVWMLDIATGQIASVSHCDCNIRLAQFEGRIYLQSNLTDSIFVYDAGRKRIIGTGYKDFNFSPSGEYYYHLPFESTDFRLFLRRTNKEVTNQTISSIKRLTNNEVNWTSAIWTDNSNLALSEDRMVTYIYDVKTSYVEDTVKGRYVANLDSTRRLFISEKGRAVVRNIHGIRNR